MWVREAQDGFGGDLQKGLAPGRFAGPPPSFLVRPLSEWNLIRRHQAVTFSNPLYTRRAPPRRRYPTQLSHNPKKGPKGLGLPETRASTPHRGQAFCEGVRWEVDQHSDLSAIGASKCRAVLLYHEVPPAPSPSSQSICKRIQGGCLARARQRCGVVLESRANPGHLALFWGCPPRVILDTSAVWGSMGIELLGWIKWV
jgi:hypothetical protein